MNCHDFTKTLPSMFRHLDKGDPLTIDACPLRISHGKIRTFNGWKYGTIMEDNGWYSSKSGLVTGRYTVYPCLSHYIPIRSHDTSIFLGEIPSWASSPVHLSFLQMFPNSREPFAHGSCGSCYLGDIFGHVLLVRSLAAAGGPYLAHKWGGTTWVIIWDEKKHELG